MIIEPFVAVAERLESESVIELMENIQKDRKHFSFSCDISTFEGGKLLIGQGYKKTYGSWIEITEETVGAYSYFSFRTEPLVQNLAPTPHGIQIKDFLKVVIDVDVLSGGAMITLMSSGGIYSLPKRFSFTGWNGSPFARVEQATLTNCKLSFGCDNYAKKIWFFGASYLGITSADRWPYYLYRNGYGNVMIAGFGGMGAKRGMEELRLALTRGVPEYVVWCLGGNNADSRNSTPIDSEWLSSMSDNFNFSDSVNVKEINSEWLVSTLEFLNLCKEYGIKPVLATIPSNPIVKHDYKNEWVRKSGIRYIDFAASVGADKDINWYPEMMFTDRVHPTVLGAQAMYMQVLSDFPEVMQKI